MFPDICSNARSRIVKLQTSSSSAIRVTTRAAARPVLAKRRQNTSPTLSASRDSRNSSKGALTQREALTPLPGGGGVALAAGFTQRSQTLTHLARCLPNALPEKLPTSSGRSAEPAAGAGSSEPPRSVTSAAPDGPAAPRPRRGRAPLPPAPRRRPDRAGRETKRPFRPAPSHGGSGGRHEPAGNTCSARSDVLQLPPVTDFPLPAALPGAGGAAPPARAPALPHLSPDSPRSAVATPRARFHHRPGRSTRLPAAPPPPSRASPETMRGRAASPRHPQPGQRGRAPPRQASEPGGSHGAARRGP